MSDLVNFLKEIFLMKESANHKVGLSQFKMEEVIEQVKPKKNNGAEIKLSDLMRRA